METPTINTRAEFLRLASMPDADARREYFTPGSIVESYGGLDRVMEYRPTGHPISGWSVVVVGIDGNDRAGQTRIHATVPEFRRMARMCRQ